MTPLLYLPPSRLFFIHTPTQDLVVHALPLTRSHDRDLCRLRRGREGGEAAVGSGV